mmetsp:Transcript_7394/g.14624  ORF Transcript_7394/g.14624 Transcript_7394/m.14624 type:complete len:313 (+) Transcript_7394:474-1412(+)
MAVTAATVSSGAPSSTSWNPRFLQKTPSFPLACAARPTRTSLTSPHLSGGKVVLHLLYTSRNASSCPSFAMASPRLAHRTRRASGSLFMASRTGAVDAARYAEGSVRQRRRMSRALRERGEDLGRDVSECRAARTGPWLMIEKLEAGSPSLPAFPSLAHECEQRPCRASRACAERSGLDSTISLRGTARPARDASSAFVAMGRMRAMVVRHARWRLDVEDWPPAPAADAEALRGVVPRGDSRCPGLSSALVSSVSVSSARQLPIAVQSDEFTLISSRLRTQRLATPSGQFGRESACLMVLMAVRPTAEEGGA